MTSSGSIKIIQITDSHIRKDEQGTLLGMNTRASLNAVLELVKQREEAPDLVLATGDIAQDGSAEAYRHFKEKMADFSCPVVWFSGNHGDPEVMTSAVADSRCFKKIWTNDYWKLIFLDSSVRARVYGELAVSELNFLRQELAADTDKHVAICFHHHPVQINSTWLDTIGLQNGDEFFSVVDKYPRVRLVLWGHIHQEFDRLRDKVRLLASPSTCVQFKPGSADFSVDSLSPGYRWLRLDPNGGIDTAVVRADHIDFEVDLASKGY